MDEVLRRVDSVLVSQAIGNTYSHNTWQDCLMELFNVLLKRCAAARKVGV
jgi:hypothetical protein